MEIRGGGCHQKLLGSAQNFLTGAGKKSYRTQGRIPIDIEGSLGQTGSRVVGKFWARGRRRPCQPDLSRCSPRRIGTLSEPTLTGIGSRPTRAALSSGRRDNKVACSFVSILTCEHAGKEYCNNRREETWAAFRS